VRVSCYFTVGRPADFFGWLGFRLAGDELFGLAANTRAASFHLLINMQPGCTARVATLPQIESNCFNAFDLQESACNRSHDSSGPDHLDAASDEGDARTDSKVRTSNNAGQRRAWLQN
jgi:hypothetical protein